MNDITPQDMMALQNNNYSVFAEGARPVLLKYIKEGQLDADEKKYLNLVKGWDLYANPNSTGATVYQSWFDSLEVGIWNDEWEKDSISVAYPDEQTLLEWINKDSAFHYVDNINTRGRETIYDVVTTALKKAVPSLKKEEQEGKLAWSDHKDPTIYHLIKQLTPFSKKIHVGGWSNIINATTHSHGPSWRMIVHLTTPTEAYGVYPGGQSGNPGSRFYDDMVDTWARGKYHTLWMMKKEENRDKRIIGILSFTNV